MNHGNYGSMNFDEEGVTFKEDGRTSRLRGRALGNDLTSPEAGPYSAETGTATAGSALARRALFLTLLVTPNANDSPNVPASNARMT